MPAGLIAPRLQEPAHQPHVMRVVLLLALVHLLSTRHLRYSFRSVHQFRALLQTLGGLINRKRYLRALIVALHPQHRALFLTCLCIPSATQPQQHDRGCSLHGPPAVRRVVLRHFLCSDCVVVGRLLLDRVAKVVDIYRRAERLHRRRRNQALHVDRRSSARH